MDGKSNYDSAQRANDHDTQDWVKRLSDNSETTDDNIGKTYDELWDDASDRSHQQPTSPSMRPLDDHSDLWNDLVIQSSCQYVIHVYRDFPW